MSTDEVFETLDEAACLRLLGEHSFGRIAFQAAGLLEIFPVNYVLDRDAIVLRTAAGTKLAGLLVAADAAFEIDGIEPGLAWSVVAHGPARRVEDAEELARLAELPLAPLAPTVKPEFVSIRIDRLSGRRFAPGPEPEPPVETAA